MMSASQAIFRTVEAVTGPVNNNDPVCCSGPGPQCTGPLRRPGVLLGPGCRVRAAGRTCRTGRARRIRGAGAGRAGGVRAEPAEQVPVVDGDHDLGPEPARGGQLAGGEGEFAAADQAVEQLLRPGAQVQATGIGIVRRAGIIRRSGLVR